MINKVHEVKPITKMKRCCTRIGCGSGSGIYMGDASTKGCSYFSVWTKRSYYGGGKGYGSGNSKGGGYG